MPPRREISVFLHKTDNTVEDGEAAPSILGHAPILHRRNYPRERIARATVLSAAMARYDVCAVFGTVVSRRQVRLQCGHTNHVPPEEQRIMIQIARPSCTWVLAATVFVALAAPAWTAEFHVAPDGNDAWSGRLARANSDKTDGPLATLTAARDAVRKLKALGPLAEPVRVVVAGGVYPVTGSLVLEPADSGTPQFPITYEAAPGAKPVFSGGRPITGFTPGPDGVWTAKVPGVAEGKWQFEQLWVNSRRAVRARSPNKFYHYVLKKVDAGTDPATGQAADLTNRAFQARAADVAPLLDLPQAEMTDVTVVAYHAWETSRSRVAGVDRATNTVVVTAAIPWGFAYWGPNCRYHLENFRAALDEPGEWFLGRDGTLSYLPRPGEDMTKAEVIAPVVDEFVRVAGQPEAGRFVEHVTLRGLSFQHGQYLLPPTGHADGQAEVTIPAAITLDGAHNVAIEAGEVKHVGTYGLWFRRGCHNCRVTGSWFDDLGAGGVKIGEGWGVDLSNPAVQTHHITCHNNIIHAGRANPSTGRSACGSATAARTRSRTTTSATSTTPAFRSAGAGATPRTSPTTTRSISTTSTTSAGACSATWAASTPWAYRPAPRSATT